MTIPSEIIARQMHLPRAQTHDVICEEDLRVPMDDGVVLLADRWVARESATEAQPTVLVRSPYGRKQFVGLLFGRLLAERGLQVVVQSVRGTFGSGGRFSPFDERADGLATLRWIRAAALARRADRDDRAELPGPRPVGGRARRGRRSGGAVDPGQRLAVPRPDLRRRQPVARDLGLVAGARRRAGAAVRAAGDGPRAAAAAGAARRAAAGRTSTCGPPAREVDWFREALANPDRADAYWVSRDYAAGVAKVTAPVQFIGGWYDIFLPWMLEDFAALQAAGHDAAADHRALDAHRSRTGGGRDARRDRVAARAPARRRPARARPRRCACSSPASARRRRLARAAEAGRRRAPTQRRLWLADDAQRSSRSRARSACRRRPLPLRPGRPDAVARRPGAAVARARRRQPRARGARRRAHLHDRAACTRRSRRSGR